MNAVESLLTRLELTRYVNQFKSEGIERIQQIRQMTRPELSKLIASGDDVSKLMEALHKGAAPVPGSADPSHPPSSFQQNTHPSGERGRGGRGQGRGGHDNQRGGHDNPRGRGGRGRGGYDRGGYDGHRGGYDGHRGGYEHRDGHGGRGGHTEGRPTGGRICAFFSTPQGCKKGESCNLLHIPGERPELPPHTERRTNTCRDFFDKGCKYGDKCRFSHTRPAGGSTGAPPPPKEPTNGQENGEGEELEARRTRDYEPKPGEYSEEISVPAERVKLLLGNHAKKLHDINSSRGTNNSKIEKPESFHETITFKVYGAKEAVELAKKDIEKIVGITKARQEEARFQYMLKECERNARYMEMLAMANMRLRGTSEELSEDILKQISSCFKFEKRVNNVQQYVIEIDGYDKTRIDIVDTILGKMENNIQSVVFCSAEKVVKVVEKSQRKKPFGGANVVYLKPPGGSVDTTKAKIDRMAALEDFKNGTTIEVAQEGGPRNVVQRLLVATDDYARYSRKNEVPFVNLVIHYNFPKTHEAYLIRNNLLGRAGNQRGVSILLAAAQDLDEVKKLQSCTQIHSINLKELNDRLDVISKSLQDAVDTKERPLTKYSECEPRNSTWREELLKKEKATDAVERVDK